MSTVIGCDRHKEINALIVHVNDLAGIEQEME